MRRFVLTAACAALMSACSGSGGNAQPAGPAAGASPPGPPEETQAPNVPSQRPAFPGQTRAPKITTDTRFRVVTFARGLQRPWGAAFLPDGRMLVSERPGRLRLIDKAGALSAPIAGVPAVTTGGQLGLFDVELDPAFAQNRLVYIAYAARAEGGSPLTVARAKLAEGEGAPRLENLQVIFRAEPTRGGMANIGGRMVFAPDGTLFVTVGDRFDSMAMAQTLDNHLGKTIRINADGSVPKDNPFVGRAGAKPEIWSYGERNGEAAAINPWTRKLWVVEHGARGGDEINIPQAGKNYGWPVITYGEDYSGKPIGAGVTQQAGMEQPIYYWDPVLAPSGMAFYDANLFPAWKGSLFVGGLGSQHVARLTLQGDKVIGEEWLLGDLNERFRDILVGPEGAIYILTDAGDGRVLKLVPQ